MIDLMPEIGLLVDRITDKVSGFKNIAPFDDWPNGGDFEDANLPAVFVGDAGDMLNFASRNSEQIITSSDVFLSFYFRRKTGAFAAGRTLMNNAINACLFDNGQRWKPPGHDLPFDLQGNRPPAIYYPTFVVRNIILTSNRSGE